MPDVKWIKIPSNIFEHPKLKEIEEYKDRDKIILVWMHFVLGAAKHNHGNRYEYSIAPNVKLTDHTLETVFNIADIKYPIKILQKLNMIQHMENSVLINPFWIPAKRDRNNSNYKAWRSAVMKRDDYTCKGCDKKGRLFAHHIIHWSKNEALRYDVSNGITLCMKCHLKAHGGCFRG